MTHETNDIQQYSQNKILQLPSLGENIIGNPFSDNDDVINFAEQLLGWINTSDLKENLCFFDLGLFRNDSLESQNYIFIGPEGNNYQNAIVSLVKQHKSVALHRDFLYPEQFDKDKGYAPYYKLIFGDGDWGEEDRDTSVEGQKNLIFKVVDNVPMNDAVEDSYDIKDCLKEYRTLVSQQRDIKGRRVTHAYALPIVVMDADGDLRTIAQMFLGFSEVEVALLHGGDEFANERKLMHRVFSMIGYFYSSCYGLKTVKQRQLEVAEIFAKGHSAERLSAIFCRAFDSDPHLRKFRDNLCFFDFNITHAESNTLVVLAPDNQRVAKNGIGSYQFMFYTQAESDLSGVSLNYSELLSSYVQSWSVGKQEAFKSGLVDYDKDTSLVPGNDKDSHFTCVVKDFSAGKYLFWSGISKKNDSNIHKAKGFLAAKVDGKANGFLAADEYGGIVQFDASDRVKVAGVYENALEFWNRVAASTYDRNGMSCKCVIGVPFMEDDTNVSQLFVGLSGGAAEDMDNKEDVNDFIDSVLWIVKALRRYIRIEEDSRKDERARLAEAYTKVAIGSIMSRNGSHNIGSHVLSALSHNVGTMPDDRVLYQYIQHRMDYIATATTEFPQWTTPTMFVAGLMKNFYSQKHLLDYISRSEGLRAYKFQERNLDDAARMNQHGTIRIFLRRFYGAKSKTELPSANRRYLTYDLFNREWSIYYFFGEKDKLFQQKFPKNKRAQYEISESGGTAKFLEYDGHFTPDWKQDVRIAIPGGIVGQHAFYTIIENVVRNAAKHGWASEKSQAEKDLEINVDFLERDEDVAFTVSDNVSDVFGEARNFWNDFFRSFDSIDQWKEFFKDNVSIRKEIDSFIGKDVRVGMSATDVTNANVLWAETRSDQTTIEMEQEAWRKILLTVDANDSKSLTIKQLTAEIRKPFLFLFLKELSIGEAKRLEEYLRIDKRDDSLPLIYRIQRAYLEDKYRKGLTHNTPIKKDDEDIVLGRRLILPLHHDLHRKLSQSFIDSARKLRKGNWGLAEMKISAGYLAQRETAEIGGLDEKGNDIIVPVAMPGVCRNIDNPHNCLACTDWSRMLCYNDKDCPWANRRFHLGYRFHVTKPKDVLVILAEGPELPNPLPEDVLAFVSLFNGAQVDFAYAKEIKKKNHLVGYECYSIENGTVCDARPIKRLNYRYVVVPGWPEDEAERETVCSHFCFRSVTFEEIISHPKDIADESKRSKRKHPKRVGVEALLQYFKQLGGENGGKDGDKVETLCREVQAAWVKKLAKECRKIENRPVRLIVNVDGNEIGSERGLVTRKDLLQTMFVECYHTALIAFLKNPPEAMELSDTTCHLIALLSLIKVMPDKMVESQQDYGHGDDYGAKEYIRAQLVAYCDLFKSHLHLSSEFIDALKSIERYVKDADGTGDAIIARKIEDIEKNFEKSIARRLFRGKQDDDDTVRQGCEKLIAFLCKVDKVDLDGWIDAFHGGSGKYKCPSRKDSYLPGRHSFGDNLKAIINACSVPEEDEFNALVESLNSMFLASDVYLRKYEERIATLPEAYKHDGRDKAGRNETKGKSVQQIADDLLGTTCDDASNANGCTVIKYSRHDRAMPENAIYAEALSGSQSYLNAMSRLVSPIGQDQSGERYADVARLLENAFLRILIIDERVMNFVEERSSDEMRKTFINMGIWIADVMNHDTAKASSLVKDALYKFRRYSEVKQGDHKQSTCVDIQAGQFDVLVIHQGIIDKWWERHDPSKVKKILNDLRLSIPRVVVTTGRGRPENIPEDEKVLPFSVIESSLFRRYPEKPVLVNTIMNLLPYGKQGRAV